MSLSEFDLQNMQARLARARAPKLAAEKDAAKAERWAAGEEKSLQDEIQKYAQLNGCYVVRPPMHKRSQLPAGYPDLSIHRNGASAFIEAKAKGGVLSPDQVQCHAEMLRAGCSVRTVWNLTEAIAFVREALRI